jgi:hypothetical protein
VLALCQAMTELGEDDLQLKYHDVYPNTDQFAVLVMYIDIKRAENVLIHTYLMIARSFVTFSKKVKITRKHWSKEQQTSKQL